ncbi:hypothetical protein J18TS1_36840 [Oceanobacillus oncorhynchi subsp. incaldanensis]|nr:hypothetical protein J18TS1_36840 [Oceanobacillus oncorhynchi subsp. incaldanensis]
MCISSLKEVLVKDMCKYSGKIKIYIKKLQRMITMKLSYSNIRQLLRFISAF